MSRMMFVSCRATPRFSAYSRARGFRHPKILMQMSPMADATRRQYSCSSPNVVYRVMSRSMATPSMISSKAFRGRLNLLTNGCRRCPWRVAGRVPSKQRASSARQKGTAAAPAGRSPNVDGASSIASSTARQ